jgi:hypothetical protein
MQHRGEQALLMKSYRYARLVTDRHYAYDDLMDAVILTHAPLMITCRLQQGEAVMGICIAS